MSAVILKNVLAFLARTPLSGSESYAWCEANEFVKALLASVEAPQAAAPAAMLVEPPSEQKAAP